MKKLLDKALILFEVIISAGIGMVVAFFVIDFFKVTALVGQILIAFPCIMIGMVLTILWFKHLDYCRTYRRYRNMGFTKEGAKHYAKKEIEEDEKC